MRSLDDEYVIELTAFHYTFLRNTEAELIAECGNVSITWHDVDFQSSSSQVETLVQFTAWDITAGMGCEKELGSLLVPKDLNEYGDSSEFNEFLQKFAERSIMG